MMMWRRQLHVAKLLHLHLHLHLLLPLVWRRCWGESPALALASAASVALLPLAWHCFHPLLPLLER